jgi:hypothetical protein
MLYTGAREEKMWDESNERDVELMKILDGKIELYITPKDKAIELYIKYIDAYNNINLQVSDYKFAKQCALIAVDEMLSVLIHEANPLAYYWQEVKEEIEKL